MTSPSLCCFVHLDGREIVAATPREVFEAMRQDDTSQAEDLGGYLDLLARRGKLMYAVTLDVGSWSDDLEQRCRQALASLIQHGWLRVKKASATWPPRERRVRIAVEGKASPPAA